MILRLIKDITWFIFEHGVKTLCSGTSSIMIINFLSPEKYGILSISLSIFTVLTAISSLGLDSILLKKLIEKTDYDIVAKSYKLRLIGSIIISVVGLISFIFIKIQWLNILILLFISLYFDSFKALKELTFAGKSYKNIVFSNSIASIAQLITVILIINFKLSIEWFVLPFIFKSLIFILTLFVLEWEKAKNTLYISKGIDLKLLRQGIPLMIASVSGLIYAVQDQWMIKIFTSDTQLGIYSAGIKFVMILLVTPTIVTNVLYHKIIHLKGSIKFDFYMQSLYSILFYLGLAIYFVIYIFSEYIIDYIFPQTYQTSKDILVVYSFILIFGFFQSLNNKILVLFDMEKVIMKRVLISLIFNLIFNLFLIPIYGIIGAAYATVFSELFVLVSYSFEKSTRKIFIFQLKAINPILIKNFLKILH